ncbi:MAG TPA: HAMP domain-containing sensor histidine kinase [Allosphingosinicella sp.]|jgi:hypothetical protein
MRFDDMIATVLAQPADRPDRRSAQWRQLVDLLAQPRAGGGAEQRARAFDFLRRHRESVPAAVRAEAARTLVGLPVDPELVLFFAEDKTTISAPLIAGAHLEREDWLEALPRLGPRGRALLRHRRDLAPEVRKALASFGAADFVIEGSSVPPAEGADAGESQIRELVERIEAFRRHKQEQGGAAAPPVPERAEAFRWETASDGMIRWIHGAPREALIGQTIAAIAGPGQHGVDGQAAGAFEKRSPFRDARFSVAGEGPASGDWRVSGVPFFDPVRGSFQGYRGTARRPRIDEIAVTVAAPEVPPGIFGTHLPPDSLRQLIHELRTPLNAILGFAEMIEGQYMGPASIGYRSQASEIMERARRLLTAVDDLDTAARLETQRLHLVEGTVDAAALLGRLHESYERVAGQRGARLALAVVPDLPPARVEAGAAERMFARLLAAAIGLTSETEEITARLDLEPRPAGDMLRLAVDRPRSIVGLDEAALLDPGYSPEGDWPAAPALGLGFALRLVRNLAEAAGGALDIEPESIVLHLPALAAAAAGTEQSEGSA